MKTLPIERRFETLSYLPPLTDQQIAKQIQYVLDQGYFAAVEFDAEAKPETYYWTMWKLPLFAATSVQEVLNEVNECRNEYRDSYIRVVAYDNVKQCQVMSFIVHKPGSGSSYRY